MTLATLAMADFGRLARSTSVAGIMAERPEITVTAANSMQELVSRHGKYVEDNVERLVRAADAGTIRNVDPVVQALTEAKVALADAQASLKASTKIIAPEKGLGFAGIADARGGVAALNTAASKLIIAQQAVRGHHDMRVLSAATSEFVHTGEDATRVLAQRTGRADSRELSPGVRKLLNFSPMLQRLVVGIYDLKASRSIGTTTTMAESRGLAAQRQAGVGTMYIGSHVSQADPPEFARSILKQGGKPVRALCADSVMHDVDKMKLGPLPVTAGDLMRKGGMFAVHTKTADGEVINAKDAMTHMLRDGQDVMIFPQGHLFPYPGTDGDSLTGAAFAAVQTGAPIRRTATHGLQRPLDLGTDAAEGRKPLTMILDQVATRQVDRSSPEFDEAVYQVTEVLSQLREQDQHLVRQMYLAQ